MRIKICGITRLEDALVCEEAGADAIGFIFVPNTKRYILPVNAARISSQISGLVSRIGVFRNVSLEEILQIARQVQLSAVQLHGSETDDFMTNLERHFPVIRAVSYQPRMVMPPAQTLLLDGLEAGSGQVFDWGAVDTSHLKNRRWLLAGGLNPDNVRQAVRLVEFSKNGRTWRYITNVLDPQMLSIREISLLYACRWDIEKMFNLTKSHLQHHFLWSSHVNVVLHKVYAVFTVAQIILATRCEIASRANADVFDVSLDLMIRWIPRFVADGVDPIQVIAERGRAAKLIRDSTRMKWLPSEVSLKSYTFLPIDTVLTRNARYTGKL